MRHVGDGVAAGEGVAEFALDDGSVGVYGGPG